MIHDAESLGFTIPEFDVEAAGRAQQRWDSIAKPLNSLGLLEKAIVRIAGVTGDPAYRIDKRALIVCCADNSVVRHGVSQAGGEVTAALARALAKSDISVCKMAKAASVDVFGVDMGMNENLGLPGLWDRRIAAGTGDISAGPAMSREQALQALGHGIDMARWCGEQGYKILATGELGIGNTTTSSAITAVLLDKSPAEVTGRGTGLSPEGMKNKVAVIERAIEVNKPDPGDAIDVLAKLGGFDIAGLAGVYLGAAERRIPVLVDGLISSAAALIAKRLRPAAGMAMLASHVSAEPAAAWLLEELELNPVINAGMCLGEGTGAVAALPLLDLAYAVYDGMSTYDALSIGSYKPIA